MLTLVVRAQRNVACGGSWKRVLYSICLFELITLIIVINLYLNEQSIPLFVQYCWNLVLILDMLQAPCASEDVFSEHLGNLWFTE